MQMIQYVTNFNDFIKRIVVYDILFFKHTVNVLQTLNLHVRLSIPSITELNAAMISAYFILKGSCELHLTFQYPPYCIISQWFYYKKIMLCYFSCLWIWKWISSLWPSDTIYSNKNPNKQAITWWQQVIAWPYLDLSSKGSVTFNWIQFYCNCLNYFSVSLVWHEP